MGFLEKFNKFEEFVKLFFNSISFFEKLNLVIHDTLKVMNAPFLLSLSKSQHPKQSFSNHSNDDLQAQGRTYFVLRNLFWSETKFPECHTVGYSGKKLPQLLLLKQSFGDSCKWMKAVSTRKILICMGFIYFLPGYLMLLCTVELLGIRQHELLLHKSHDCAPWNGNGWLSHSFLGWCFLFYSGFTNAGEFNISEKDGARSTSWQKENSYWLGMINMPTSELLY